MSQKGKKNVQSTKNNEVHRSSMSAAKESAKKLALSRALSHCKDSHGGYVLLCSAIKSGDIKRAKFLLRKGAKVECPTYDSSPLHFAMRQTSVDLELVCLLLEKNATIDALNSRKETPLHRAAEKGCVEIVRVLLEKNADVTAQTIEGSTPLLLAVESGHEEVACILFEHACANVTDLKDSLPPVSQIEKRNKTLLLRTAVRNGYKEFIKLFLNSGFDVNAKDEKDKTCLHYLVDRLEIVKLSLEGGLDVNAKDKRGNVSMLYLLNCEGEDECVEILRLLLASGANINAAPELLHSAVSKRSIKVCKVLIEKGADVNVQNSSGNTALHLAVSDVDSEQLENRRKVTEAVRNEIIKLLLNNGADVSVKAQDGLTAFHHAAANGRKKTIQIFLNSGVNVDLRANNNSTPLYLAAEQGRLEIVKILIENGANVDACQKKSWTPLHQAAHYGECELIRILLDNGCDINAETIGTQTALDLAILQARNDFATKQSERYWLLFGDSSESDTDPDEYDSVVTLKRHVCKLKAAGLYVSQNNLDLLNYTDSENLSYEGKCAEEVSRMASKMLGSPLLLSYILKTSRNLSLARSKLTVRTFESFNFEEFPIYESLLRNTFEASKFRLQLSILGQKSLDILVRASNKSNRRKCIVFPVELLELLISFLSITDLRSLISCSNALKHQKSH